ncbi:MAG TPA: hypothetical protein VFJ06_02750 [Halococcus sp.]|nr:hypothetical protein [Halococcus sp.]
MEVIVQRLFGQNTEHVTQFDAERLTIATQDSTTIDFTLDDEPNSDEQLALTVRQRTLSVRIGPTYDPSTESD